MTVAPNVGAVGLYGREAGNNAFNGVHREPTVESSGEVESN